jgi:hypothetical protein
LALRDAIENLKEIEMAQTDTAPVSELKIKSQLLKKSFRREPTGFHNWMQSLPTPDLWSNTPPKLQEVQDFIAKKAGFHNWRHAVHYLSGGWHPGEDAGTFWYSNRCTPLLNIWCRNEEEAKAELRKMPHLLILPYKKQFILANEDYLTAIGIQSVWQQKKKEIAAEKSVQYMDPDWQDLSLARIRTLFENL